MSRFGKIFLHTLIMFIIIIMTSSLIGCVNGSEHVKNKDKLMIVTTIFPNYDFAKQIAKDKAEIILLLPPGVEAHSYEPTPKDIVNAVSADIFIYTGEIMEPWADKIIKSSNNKQQLIVKSGDGVKLSDNHHSEEDDEDDHNDHDNSADPHIWVNPDYAMKMVENIKNAIVKADPSNEQFYTDNYNNYIKKLSELDKQISDTISNVNKKTIIYGGHFVFGYFAERYGLNYVSPYKGFSPDAEPSPQKIIELINKMKELDINVIYYEELTESKVSRVISEQTGAEMLLLHGAHNVSKKDFNSGITYIDIMKNNLENLKKGLGYNE